MISTSFIGLGNDIRSRPIRRKFSLLTFLLFGYMLILFQDEVTNLKCTFVNTFFIGKFDKFLVDLEMVNSIEMTFI